MGNKILILAITAFFSIVGIAYALLAPQKWSAKAVIVAPFPDTSWNNCSLDFIIYFF